jgi:DNA-binding transcriptional LysR family regulator
MQNRFPKSQNASSPGFDWNDLKYFLAVAREGGLSKAALQLQTSASTVSRHIGALEKRLDVRLFVRLSTGYLLTDAGSELFECVAEVERSTHAVERGSSVAAEADKVTGLVRLAASDSIGTLLLAPELPRLRQRHPGLRVEMVLSHVQADLTRREADVALRMLDPSLSGAHPDHVMHRIGGVVFGLYAARALLNGTAPSTVDWQRLDHIGWDAAWRHLPVAQWMAQAFDGRPPVFTSNSMTAQMAAARVGLGVSALPSYLGDLDASLVRLPVELKSAQRELWLVYHRDLRSSSRVQAVRAFIEEVLPPALENAAR